MGQVTALCCGPNSQEAVLSKGNEEVTIEASKRSGLQPFAEEPLVKPSASAGQGIAKVSQAAPGSSFPKAPAAAVSKGADYQLGEKVEVQDEHHHAWCIGKVTRLVPLEVNGHAWERVRKLQPHIDIDVEDVAVAPVEEKPQPPLRMHSPIAMVGVFSKWKYEKTSTCDAWMNVTESWPATFAPLPAGMVRLSKCVKTTSASFSFQVVCPDKAWTWRLYPRDFKALMWGVHVSKEGVLKPGDRERVVIGVGDGRKGDGKNLHIVGRKGGGDIVTVWMDLPVKPVDLASNAWELDTSSEEVLQGRAPKVWFVFEDAGDPAVQSRVQLAGGDGQDIERYRARLEEGMA